MYLSSYADLAASDASELPPYLGNQVIPEINSLWHWPPYLVKSSPPSILLGPKGTSTPLHCDYDDNLFAQLWERKRYMLFPSHYSDFLYTLEVTPVLYGSSYDSDAPDFKPMPLARNATPLGYLVAQGELLYLPAGWFHHVRALDFSLWANLWTKNRQLALYN